MKKQRRGLNRYVLQDGRTSKDRQTTPLKIWKQMKNISWAPVDLATDESSGPNQLKWKALGRGHHRVWRPIHQRAIKECSKAINHDWVNN